MPCVGIGLETLTDGRRAFLNLSHDVLLSDASSLLDPEAVVLEILENVTAIARGRRDVPSLRRRGYAGGPRRLRARAREAEALLPLADS